MALNIWGGARKIGRGIHDLRMKGKVSSYFGADKEKTIVKKTGEVFGNKSFFSEKDFKEKVLNLCVKDRKTNIAITEGLGIKEHSTRIVKVSPDKTPVVKEIEKPDIKEVKKSFTVQESGSHFGLGGIKRSSSEEPTDRLSIIRAEREAKRASSTINTNNAVGSNDYNIHHNNAAPHGNPNSPEKNNAAGNSGMAQGKNTNPTGKPDMGKPSFNSNNLKLN